MTTHLRKKPIALALLAGLALAGTTSAMAQSGDAFSSTSPYLFGDWGGARTRLADEGITFNLGYGSEAAHNFSGGTDHLTRYTDQWVLGAGFDLQKLWGWHDATFNIVVTDRNGRDIGADAHIGNNQLIQEVYGRGQTWHLTELSYAQKYFDGKLDWKIGRLTVGGDFAAFSCDFQNLTFCGAQPGNLVGNYWVNWPTSQWASRLKFNTGDTSYIMLGAYQVNPKYVDDRYARHHGLDPDFPSGTLGWLIPLEFGWTPSVNGLPGSYKFGVWDSTAGGDDVYEDLDHHPKGLTHQPALSRDNAYGAYINFEQQVSGEAGGRGTSLFLNATQTDRYTAATDRQISLGMKYHDPFGRPQDFIGFAVGATHNNERYYKSYVQANGSSYNPSSQTYVGNGYEYVSELFYSWAPIASVQFRPNLQYVMHPGGTTRNSNAFVLGLKTQIAF